MRVATLLAQATPEFPDQVTTNSLLQNLIYASGTVGAIMILAGLLMVDSGGVRRVNVFAAAIEKMVGFFIGFVVYFLIGFAIWNWQYYVAFDIADPYWQAIKDWWLGGSYANDLAQNVDPAPTVAWEPVSTTSRSSSSSSQRSPASSTCSSTSP